MCGCCYQRIDSRVDPLVVFGRFHFHFFERQHNSYQLTIAMRKSSILSQTKQNKTNIKKASLQSSLAVPQEIYFLIIIYHVEGMSVGLVLGFLLLDSRPVPALTAS